MIPTNCYTDLQLVLIEPVIQSAYLPTVMQTLLTSVKLSFDPWTALTRDAKAAQPEGTYTLYFNLEVTLSL